MKSKVLILLLGMSLSIPLKAEGLLELGPYRRGEWTVQFTTRSQLLEMFSWAIIPRITSSLLVDEATEGQLPWFGNYYELYIPYKLETPYGELKPKRFRWWGGNYSMGIKGGYMSYNIPLGFYVGVYYSHQRWEVEMPGTDYYTQFNKSMICPEAILRFRFGSYYDSKICPLLDIGGCYNYAFKSNNKSWQVPSSGISVAPSKDLDVVNNGYTGILGIGVLFPSSHINLMLMYRHDYYNYFNNNYTINGVKPYDGWKTQRGALSLAVEYGF